MEPFYNISIGDWNKLKSPVFWTLLSNFVNIIPFGILLQAVALLIAPMLRPGTEFNIVGLSICCALMIVCMPLMFVFQRLAYRAQYLGAYSVSEEGRVRLAEHLRKLPLGFLSSRDPGYLTNMMVLDFATVEQSVSHHVPQLIAAMILPCIAFVGLCFLDWRFALVMFAPLPLSLVTLWIATNLMHYFGTKHVQAKVNAGNRIQEYLSGIKVIKSLNLTGTKFARLEKALRDFMKMSIFLEGALMPVCIAAIALLKSGLPLMVLVGVPMMLYGNLSIFHFIVFLVIGTRVYDPLISAILHYAELRYAELAGKRILSLLNETPQVGERETPKDFDITFEKVDFSYGEKKVLHDISLSLKSGELTALVGPSGCGKSTLSKLAARFYDPASGRIAFGNVNEQEIDPESLLRKFAIVFQDVYLFQDTIGNNIRYGKADATDEEVHEAAEKACCHDFISRLPNGYDTMIGEGGCTLSGGEKQRISIARALLKNAPVVLLDEATASLDPENERDVQRAIDKLVENRTVVVIAHKLKTIAHADKIVVLSEGRIVEQGTHDELLAHNGLFTRLWNLQQDASSWSVKS